MPFVMSILILTDIQYSTNIAASQTSRMFEIITYQLPLVKTAYGIRSLPLAKKSH